MLIHCGGLRCKSMKRGKEMAITVLIYFSPYISCSFFLPLGGGGSPCLDCCFFFFLFLYSIYLVHCYRHLSVASWELSVEPPAPPQKKQKNTGLSVACRGLNMAVKLPREKPCIAVRITGCFLADCGDCKLNPSPGGHLHHLWSQLPLPCLITKRRTPTPTHTHNTHTHTHTQKNMFPKKPWRSNVN